MITFRSVLFCSHSSLIQTKEPWIYLVEGNPKFFENTIDFSEKVLNLLEGISKKTKKQEKEETKISIFFQCDSLECNLWKVKQKQKIHANFYCFSGLKRYFFFTTGISLFIFIIRQFFILVLKLCVVFKTWGHFLYRYKYNERKMRYLLIPFCLLIDQFGDREMLLSGTWNVFFCSFFINYLGRNC